MTAIRKLSKTEFESPLPHENESMKPAVVAGFRFLTNNGGKTGAMKYIDFRPPKVVKGKKWSVTYYYRVPAELVPIVNKKWERFRVYEDINRYKDDEYADMLCDSVLKALQDGYNPFDKDLERLTFGTDKDITLSSALTKFVQKYKTRGLEPETIERYGRIAVNVNKWFAGKNLQAIPLNKINKAHIEKMLDEWKDEKGWSNRQYNNIRSYTNTIFLFFKKSEWISNNPCEGIEKLKSKSLKHRYYDERTFAKIKLIMEANDPYLWKAAQFIYYAGVRSGKELRFLKVGDIGEQIRFRAEVAKSDREDYVPVDPHLRKVIKTMKLNKYDPDYYLFGIKGEPGVKPASEDFFSGHFSRIRKLAGLDMAYTLYSFKHTRAVHLIKDGVKLADISRLFRHTDISMTAKYIRDLGVDFDSSDLVKRSRQI